MAIQSALVADRNFLLEEVAIHQSIPSLMIGWNECGQTFGPPRVDLVTGNRTGGGFTIEAVSAKMLAIQEAKNDHLGTLVSSAG
jgi:hypothetical protein